MLTAGAKPTFSPPWSPAVRSWPLHPCLRPGGPGFETPGGPSQAPLLTALSGGSLGRALALDPRGASPAAPAGPRGPGGTRAAAPPARWRWIGPSGLAKKRQTKESLDELLSCCARCGTGTCCFWTAAPGGRLLAHQDAWPTWSRAAAAQQDAWFASWRPWHGPPAAQANLNPELTLDILGFRLQRKDQS